VLQRLHSCPHHMALIILFLLYSGL
jgi:hypothetical protein